MIIKYTYNNYFQSIQLGQMDLSLGPAFLGTVMLYLHSIIGKDQMLVCCRYRTKLHWLHLKQDFPPRDWFFAHWCERKSCQISNEDSGVPLPADRMALVTFLYMTRACLSQHSAVEVSHHPLLQKNPNTVLVYNLFHQGTQTQENDGSFLLFELQN